jgi:hypothetical protein
MAEPVKGFWEYTEAEIEAADSTLLLTVLKALISSGVTQVSIIAELALNQYQFGKVLTGALPLPTTTRQLLLAELATATKSSKKRPTTPISRSQSLPSLSLSSSPINALHLELPSPNGETKAAMSAATNTTLAKDMKESYSPTSTSKRRTRRGSNARTTTAAPSSLLIGLSAEGINK